jgi:hypothetical protein
MGLHHITSSLDSPDFARDARNRGGDYGPSLEVERVVRFLGLVVPELGHHPQNRKRSIVGIAPNPVAAATRQASKILNAHNSKFADRVAPKPFCGFFYQGYRFFLCAHKA